MEHRFPNTKGDHKPAKSDMFRSRTEFETFREAELTRILKMYREPVRLVDFINRHAHDLQYSRDESEKGKIRKFLVFQMKKGAILKTIVRGTSYISLPAESAGSTAAIAKEESREVAEGIDHLASTTALPGSSSHEGGDSESDAMMPPGFSPKSDEVALTDVATADDTDAGPPDSSSARVIVSDAEEKTTGDEGSVPATPQSHPQSDVEGAGPVVPSQTIELPDPDAKHPKSPKRGKPSPHAARVASRSSLDRSWLRSELFDYFTWLEYRIETLDTGILTILQRRHELKHELNDIEAKLKTLVNR